MAARSSRLEGSPELLHPCHGSDYDRDDGLAPGQRQKRSENVDQIEREHLREEASDGALTLGGIDALVFLEKCVANLQRRSWLLD